MSIVNPKDSVSGERSNLVFVLFWFFVCFCILSAITLPELSMWLYYLKKIT